MATDGYDMAGSRQRSPSLYSQEDYEIEEPQPIYMKRLDVMQSYNACFEGDDDSYESVSDDEEGLDLSAPPSESWYHGMINRQTALDRLKHMRTAGAYLVRDSTNQPGDYAISFFSRHGQIHHFKISSICGDYYIGGRQFSSLGDLLGYYSNCSCILENERLDVPCLPPKPVPLHLMLRSTSSHVKTPGTDELSIQPGEVFLLLSRINDDWGWGQSQRTGDSGLIPFIIMEDLSGADENLGKVWFHGSIDRDEAVELLMKNGELGSFIVRVSHGAGMYSLAVRAGDRVQRFLIQKHVDTGYFVFGGRMFNSLQDVIDRYQQEEILEGVRLGLPIPAEIFSPPSRIQYPVSDMQGVSINSPRGRRPSTIITRDRPGDKAGLMLLRKGKKSPVFGKWKEFHFHFKFHEQKLLYYDSQHSHRPKGLLDLKECQTYPVDPSLYGRDDCFVVMLHYINEISFYYISAGNAEAAQDWVRLMRQCIQKRPHESVQQIRSLSMSVRDFKLSKPTNGSVYCQVLVDGTCLARTKPVVEQQSRCVFDQHFKFEDLPGSASKVTIELETLKGKRIASFIHGAKLGAVQMKLSDLPNGQDDDNWHPLGGVQGTRASRGQIRLVANFRHEIILPLEEYSSFSECILTSDLTVIEELARVCVDHHAGLASTLIQIFCHHQWVLPVIIKCLAGAIDVEDNVSTLFRSSTLATMLMDQYMKLTANDYLLAVVRPCVQAIVASVESCELNPANLPKGIDITKNLDRLEEHLTQFLDVIFQSADLCPQSMRYIFHSLQIEVATKWPSDDNVQTRAVNGFLFLRFICPVLLKPHLFNIITEAPPAMAERTLSLMTKVVQKLANLVEFKSKEPYMTALNPFIIGNMDRMKAFVSELSNVPNMPKSAQRSPDPARDWAALYQLCQTYEQKLKDVAQSQTFANCLTAGIVKWALAYNVSLVANAHFTISAVKQHAKDKVMDLLMKMQMLKATEARYLSRRHTGRWHT